MSQAEGVVTSGETCTSSGPVCLWACVAWLLTHPYLGATGEAWRELHLVEGPVLGIGASEGWNSSERDFQAGKSKHRRHCVTQLTVHPH